MRHKNGGFGVIDYIFELLAKKRNFSCKILRIDGLIWRNIYNIEIRFDSAICFMDYNGI